MSDDPFFSIIIPTYNGADRIGKAIDSCLYQSFTDFEIIVVCDSCTDKTQDIVKCLAHGDDRIRMYEACAHRDGIARNVGLDAARGQYILFLDDDDWWLHEFVLQLMFDCLKDGKSDALNFGIIWRTVGYKFQPAGSYIKMVAGHAWRREFIGDTRFDDGQYSSDVRFLTKLLERKPIGSWTALPMYYYNFMRPGSLSDLHKRGEIE